ncbi:ABC transporter permease [Actinomyces howellii]|uniref:Macrolide export ATP-binding/permease protein MacB n=1 Tax=Actinomyces howellii TaxID=52771 RepID=A0A3S4RWK2_9ACTO|nr:ABC transporter permease [Actinomyces howellii]VEG28111.1 Macrolide export ATP-binding/permease protein MacB [Actinomyces howellii]
MIRVAWRSIRAHIKQFLLTTLAVVLGVAFLSGTLALRSVMSDTFSALTDSTYTADIYVSGQPLEGTEGTSTVMTQPIPGSLVDEIAQVDGVASARREASLTGTLVGADDTPVTSQGAPTIFVPLYPDEKGLSWIQGRSPSGAAEIALESGALERSGLAVGDTTHIVVLGTPMEVTIVGEYSFGTTMAGATLVGMDAQWLLPTAAPDDQVTQISVLVDEGASVAQVKDAIASALSADVQVLTRQEAIDQTNAYVEQILGFIQTFLLVFVVLAMFVGSFIIMNSFAMSVRQRVKEFALLRAVGASPLSVFSTVFLQAVVVGAVGSVLGVAAGAALLAGLVAVLEAVGMPLLEGVPMTAQVIGVSLTVGMLVTIVGALLPAREAALTHPVEAMRGVSGAREKPLVVRTVLGGTVLALGTAAVIAAWAAEGLNGRSLVLGLGAAGLIIGLLVVSPVMARPVVALLGLPFRLLRPSGRLATRNIVHNPRRTANTSGALMVGMAVVCAGATLAASVNSSVSDIVTDSMRADFIVQPSSASMSSQIPAEMATQIASLDGVEAVAAFTGYTVSAVLPDGTQEPSSMLNVVPGASYTDFYDLSLQSGSLEDLDATHVAAYSGTGLSVGDTVTLTGPTGSLEVVVAAVVDPDGVEGSFYATPELAVQVGSWAGATPAQADQVLATPMGMFISLRDGVDAEAIRDQVEEILAPTYQYSVLDSTELSDQIGQQVNQVLGVLYALLGLSIAIAVLGIVNTLVLSVSERTREIGLMRAVGLSKSQLAGEIMVESVLTALYGTVVGAAAGIVLAAALRSVLEEEGLTVLVVPWGQLAGMLVLSVLVGVAAALWPALRASRLPVLEAIATE